MIMFNTQMNQGIRKDFKKMIIILTSIILKKALEIKDLYPEIPKEVNQNNQ